MDFKPDESLDLPIYRQLANSINSQVRSGKLAFGAKLPTVRELSDRLGIARGTIKRAYDELESSGIISKTRGRGTFVSWTEEPAQSRKDRAMEAIDRMLDAMEDMRFSSSEISIFLDLKLRERMERERLVNIAAVECCAETQYMLERSLYRLQGAEIYKRDLYDVLSYPQGFAEAADIVVTTVPHYERVSPLAKEGKTMPVAMELAPQSMAELSRLSKGRAGIFAKTEKFAAIASGALERYAPQAKLVVTRLSGDGRSMDEFLRNIDILAVPAGISRMCSAEEDKALRAFAREKSLVTLSYIADEGSMFYVAERVKAVQNRKRR